MKKPAQTLPHPSPVSWHWPIDITRYDCVPILTEAEATELNRLFGPQKHPIHARSRSILQRFVRPIDDVAHFLNLTGDSYSQAVHTTLMEIYRQGSVFWNWTEEVWRECIGPDRATFARRYQCGYDYAKHHAGRRFLAFLAYLLHLLPTPNILLELGDTWSAAKKIFGKERVDGAIQSLMAILHGWGYQEKDPVPFFSCVCVLLLWNRNPQLEQLNLALLEEIEQQCPLLCVRTHLLQISRALAALEIIQRPLPNKGGTATPVLSGTDGSVSEGWLSWCERWRKQSTLQSRQSVYYHLLKVGRWLQVHHLEVTSPADFTYELAAELVAAVNEMKIGEWSDAHQRKALKKGRDGQPLRPAAKDHLLAAIRTFLRDCQEWQWIPTRLNPQRGLRTPTSIRNLIGPDPRVVDKVAWAKILWAAMNLEAKDLPQSRGETCKYPLEMVRAIAVTWCFAALRTDELVRLRLGCIRWQYEDVMVPETREVLPKPTFRSSLTGI
jgi:hypothetical protein